MDIPAIQGDYEIIGVESGAIYGVFTADRVADTVYIPSAAWKELMKECNGEWLHAYDMDDESDMAYSVKKAL